MRARQVLMALKLLAQGTPTQSHISPSILVHEGNMSAHSSCHRHQVLMASMALNLLALLFFKWRFASALQPLLQ